MHAGAAVKALQYISSTAYRYMLFSMVSFPTSCRIGKTLQGTKLFSDLCGLGMTQHDVICIIISCPGLNQGGILWISQHDVCGCDAAALASAKAEEVEELSEQLALAREMLGKQEVPLPAAPTSPSSQSSGGGSRPTSPPDIGLPPQQNMSPSWLPPRFQNPQARLQRQERPAALQ